MPCITKQKLANRFEGSHYFEKKMYFYDIDSVLGMNYYVHLSSVVLNWEILTIRGAE